MTGRSPFRRLHAPLGRLNAVWPNAADYTPLRGQRVGEARQPGPDNETPRPSGLTTTESSTLDTLAPDMPLNDAVIPIKMVTGNTADLRCKWLRWGIGKSLSKFPVQGKGTPGAVLRDWVRRDEMEVLQAGIDEINSVLAIHPDPPLGPPGIAPSQGGQQGEDIPPPDDRLLLPATPIPSTPLPPHLATDLPTQLPVPQPHFHDAPIGNMERCRGVDFWVGKSIPSQRSIPASTLQIVDSVSRAILTSLHAPGLSGEARRVPLNAYCELSGCHVPFSRKNSRAIMPLQPLRATYSPKKNCRLLLPASREDLPLTASGGATKPGKQ